MADSPDGPNDKGMQPLFDLVLRHVPAPKVEDGPFRHARHHLGSQSLSRPHRHRRIFQAP